MTHKSCCLMSSARTAGSGNTAKNKNIIKIIIESKIYTDVLTQCRYSPKLTQHELLWSYPSVTLISLDRKEAHILEPIKTTSTRLRHHCNVIPIGLQSNFQAIDKFYASVDRTESIHLDLGAISQRRRKRWM